jgi:hypothetical protein
MNSTGCRAEQLEFQPQNGRRVIGSFDGGEITSDGGLLLLREAANRTKLLERFSDCFIDHRNPLLIRHELKELIAQRIFALACGYEDLNDHDFLRNDPLLGALIGKSDEELIASKSTLNRLELTEVGATRETRYKKIFCDTEAVRRLFVEFFLDDQPRKLRQIIIDLDATDFPLYGTQEGRFFHGYYNEYCYLPLYIVCGDHLLAAELRPSNIDASAGTVEQLERIIPIIRSRYPGVRIILRGDSAFARESIMAWCESHGVDYLFGLAKNERLLAKIGPELKHAEQCFTDTQTPSRCFKEFLHCTLDSWSRYRRVIAKAEHLEKGPNPRFIVTSLSRNAAKAMRLYEKWYCLRGDMENRIKEQLSLFADRVSTHTMRANQIRLFFSSVAYILVAHLRRVALKNTSLERAQVDTIRLRLFKIGARVIRSVRRFVVSFASGYPWREIFQTAYWRIIQT